MVRGRLPDVGRRWVNHLAVACTASRQRSGRPE